MKKVVLFFVATIVAIASMAQDRTVSITVPKVNTYYQYTGVAADTICSVVQDTVDYVFYLNKDYPVQYYLKIRNDLVTAGATATVTMIVAGKVFSDQSWSTISTNASEAISANNDDTAISSIANPSWSVTGAMLFDTTKVDVTSAFGYSATTTQSFTQTFTGSYYRYLLVRLIRVGGAGNAKLDNIQLKIWERKF